LKLKTLIFDKHGRVRLLPILLVFSLLLFFALAENIVTDNSSNLELAIPLDNLTSENNSLNNNYSNNSTIFPERNISLPEELIPADITQLDQNQIEIAPLETTPLEIIPPLENKISVETDIPTDKNLPSAETDFNALVMAQTSEHHIYSITALSNYITGQTINYNLEQTEIGPTETHTTISPFLLIDQLEFTNLVGLPLLEEIGRSEAVGTTFITTFVIDTSSTNFSAASFTKRAEGSALYQCTDWDYGCKSTWVFVQNLTQYDSLTQNEVLLNEYTIPLTIGKVAYAETMLFVENTISISQSSSESNSGLGITAGITSTQADGLVVYNELNIATPRFRTLNSSNRFSAEQSAQSLGTGGTDDPTWVIVRGNHKRNELIVGTEDKSNDVNIQIYTPENNSFGKLNEVSTDISNSAYRAFDIGVEDISGNILIVYETSSVADTTISYTIWNGQNYSSPTTLNTGLGSAVINWIELVPHVGSNDIMLLMHDSLSSIIAIPWDGASFNITKAQNLSTATISATTPHFDFAWEGTSNQGLALYGLSGGVGYRTFSLTAPYWSTEATLSTSPQNGRGGRLCGDPGSDYIGLIFQTTANDINAYMWDGSAILAGQPAKDSLTEPAGANNNNFDCVWLNSSTALFTFVDNNGLAANFFTFSRTSNTWSTADLTSTGATANFASDDIEGLRLIRHPTTNESMLTTMDILEDIYVLRWNGTSYQTIPESPIGINTEVTNAAQEGVMFDWLRYDPGPNVTKGQPDGQSFALGSTIAINVSVTDNINVSIVSANITCPNTTVKVVSLVQNPANTSMYNSTFSFANSGGTYSILFIANDTSVHQNYNTLTTTFSIADSTFPSVTNLIPVNRSVYNLSNLIEIGVNATDDGIISRVFANITYPNSSHFLLSLSNYQGDKYNTSFTIPLAIGFYNVTFIVNDTSNNFNRTTFTNFTVNDVVKPNVTNLAPVARKVYNITNTFEVGANVTDDLSVHTVYANITCPNTTIKQLTLSNKTSYPLRFNDSFTAPAAIGNYNITFYANDTSGNINASETSNFTVNDIVTPSINALNCYPASINLSNSVQCNSTVTDDLSVHTVSANLSMPNGTTELQTIQNTGSTYNFTFLRTNLPGTYTIYWRANDTSNNINDSTSNTFTINDIIKPNVTNLAPAVRQIYNISNSFEIGANVTDDVSVHTVYANITCPNTTIKQLTLSNGSSYIYRFNNTFTAPAALGNYNITFYANDTSGNINASEISNFTVQDVVKPNVTNLSPTARQIYNISSSIEIGANVTDDLAVHTVYANITCPNTTIKQLTLSNSSSYVYRFNNSFIAPAALGNYNITFYANDTSGNINASEQTNFTVQDRINPSVVITVPAPASTFSQAASVTITTTVTDDLSVSTVYANITVSNGSYKNVTLASQGSNVYSGTFVDTASTGTYWITIFANDSSNNLNNTVNRSFAVQDSAVPIVTLISPNDTSSLTNRTILFRCNATDNSALLNISLYGNFSGSFTVNQSNTTISGASATVNFTVSNIIDGNYIWNCQAADDASNKAFASANYSFSLDATTPAVSAALPSASSVFNITNTLEIAITVTDLSSLSLIWANLSYPNGTIRSITLTSAGSDKYNSSFTAPALIGTYNITYYANDSYGNLNNSVTSNFTINDIVAPSITALNCYPSNINISNSVQCNSSVTDDVLVHTVSANLTMPNGTTELQTILNISSTYNFTFVRTNIIGTYTVNWRANDTSNNINDSTSTTFTISDVVKPNVTNLAPTARQIYNISNSFEIGVNATDDQKVHTVYANITCPNTTIKQLTLSNDTSYVLRFNNTFTAPVALGNYNITFYANDSSGNINASEQTNFTIQDVVNPSVFSLLPVASSTYNFGDTVEISANVTDDFSVHTVYANITCPNTTIKQLTLSNGSGYQFKYNNSFIVPLSTGTYNITYYANDTGGNINATQSSNFSTTDTNSPTITNLGCTPTNINLSQSLMCNATITDNYALGTITANVTLPNGTIDVMSTSNVSSLYNFTFTRSLLVGQYNYTWRANDSSGNVQTSSANFNVSDVIYPSLTFNTPVNNSNTSSTTITVNFNVTDNYYSTLNCSLNVNGTAQATNTAVVNGTATNLTTSTLSQGHYTLNITCLDDSGNRNSTEERFATVDLGVPLFYTLSYSPSTAEDLDPNVNITITANVTENFTAVHTVILERKLSTESAYNTNLTLTLNTSTGLYQGVFNATDSGTYNLRLWANDTAGNYDISTAVDTVVAYDYNWTRTPSSFTINSISGQITRLGNLTINNTGDFPLNFTIKSNSTTTVYNRTENFSLGAKEALEISINETAPNAGIKSLTLNISDNQTIYYSQTVTGQIVVAPGQPVLRATFTTPSTDTRSVTQGDSSVSFVGTLENIGEADASNVTFYLSIPSDWTVTFGTLNLSYSNFASGDSVETVIEVSIPDNASTGVKTVVLNASGVNASSTDLKSLDLIFSDSVAVTVNSLTNIETSTVTTTTTSTSTSTSAGTGGGGGGGGAGGAGGGGGGLIESILAGEEFVSSEERVDLVRGESLSFKVKIKNLFDGAVLKRYLFRYARLFLAISKNNPFIYCRDSLW